MATYSNDDIIDILRTIRDADLSAPHEMLNASIADLQRICNGVGSESMGETLRKAISRVYDFATATAAVHDYRYDNSDGTPQAQRFADNEFLQNGMAELRYLYKWHNWRRWWGERKLIVAYRLLQVGGESAWCIAYRNNQFNINKG